MLLKVLAHLSFIIIFNDISAQITKNISCSQPVILAEGYAVHWNESEYIEKSHYQTTFSVQDDSSSTFMQKLNNINEFMEWYMKYFPVPYGSYSEETSWLFGISKYNAFTLRKKDFTDTITQASSISALGYFTLNHQYKISLESDLMFKNNRALWKTNFIYTHYPLEFFGIGNHTDIDKQSTLNTTDFQFFTYYLFKTWKKWYVGPVFDFYNYFDVELEGGLPIHTDSIHLVHNTGRQSGLGVKVLMEGRDNRLNAKAGFYVDASYQIFNDAFGSEYNYDYFNFDFRYYFTPYKNLTIATRFATEAKSGNIPVQSLSFLGGDYAMRGIYNGRFRDNVGMETQVELRFPIFWIIGGTVFGGLGQVAPAYKDFEFDAFHHVTGLGLRLKVDSEHDVNLRFDLGFSSDQTIFIMNFAEAF